MQRSIYLHVKYMTPYSIFCQKQSTKSVDRDYCSARRCFHTDLIREDIEAAVRGAVRERGYHVEEMGSTGPQWYSTFVSCTRITAGTPSHWNTYSFRVGGSYRLRHRETETKNISLAK